MRVLWYYRRLRSMSPGEIGWRVRRVAWQGYAWCRRRRWSARFHKGRLDRSALRIRPGIRFYGLDDARPEDVPQEWRERTTAAADRLLQHRFRYLALGEISLGREVQWNREYKRGISTPMPFGPWMDYRDTKAYGDFKYFWEVPRLQHLITLSKAYYLTGKQEYADEVAAQIGGFVRQSPYLEGVNWTMPMEAGIRLISMCWILAFLGEYLDRNASLRRDVEWILRTHLHYVTRNYAAYSSANNHLIGEAAGVFVACLCLPELDRSRRHLNKAKDLLCQSIRLQQYEDGVNKEQAVHYQIFALSFFLMAGLLGKANGVEFPPEYWDCIEKSAGYLAALASPEGHLPAIGDSDDGRAVVLEETESCEERWLLGACASFFNRPDWVQLAGTSEEPVLWLLGLQGLSQSRDLARQATETPGASGDRAFPQGGYYVLTAGPQAQVSLLLDAGPLGFGSIAAHGHADALSFVLSVQGKPMLVDPGTYTYVAGDPYRNYFRSTRAHNTLEVDGLDQSEMLGPFLWGRRASTVVDQWSVDGHGRCFSAWHDGYRRLADPVTHRRRVQVEAHPPGFVVTDTVECHGAHQVSLFFHLDPACRLEPKGRNLFIIEREGAVLHLQTADSLMVAHSRGSDNPIAGWVSPAYDVKVPAVTICATAQVVGTQVFRTYLRMADDGD